MARRLQQARTPTGPSRLLHCLSVGPPSFLDPLTYAHSHRPKSLAAMPVTWSAFFLKFLHLRVHNSCRRAGRSGGTGGRRFCCAL